MKHSSFLPWPNKLPGVGRELWSQEFTFFCIMMHMCKYFVYLSCWKTVQLTFYTLDVFFHVLFPLQCIVSSSMYCFLYHVLFPLPCIVSTTMYCFLYHILFPLPCIVSSTMYCFLYHVLFPLPCIVSSTMYCFL